jgi:ectoine hydroxylase-related dioxygenase (phytanoyl-CoA dioxygenase family)
MIPRTSRGAQSWTSTVLEGLQCLGCAVVEGVVNDELLQATREGLRQAQRGIEAEIGRERLERAGELGVVRLPMRFAPVFFRFLELPEVLAVVDRTVSDTAILHLQNGLVLPPLDGSTPEGLFQLSFHMDFRRVLNGYLCSINTLFAIDAFTADNGGTLVVPGSHQKTQAPDARFLRENAVAVECPAGSMLVFDSTLWHAAGRNLSGRDRLGLNQQFTRSYFKQQIDYVRALGDDVVLAQPPRTQQLLGWYTRVVMNLDSFYQPADQRLYRAGQG